MTEKRQVELDADEQAFIKALHEGNEALMLAIFTKKNGTWTEETIRKAAAAPEAEASAQPAAPEFDTDLAAVTLTFVEAWKAGNLEALQRLVDDKRGASLPPSHVARERTRARQIAPEIRFRLQGVLEDIEQVISDSACRISSARPNGEKEGVFEEDAIATQILHGVCDFFSLYPNINQMSNEYHVRPYFDLEWDYTQKLMKAFDANGKVIAVEDLSDGD